MEVTTKELRIHPGKILDQVVNGEEVTVTYRGKRIARIVPVEQKTDQEIEGMFGLWAERDSDKSVAELMTELRKGRDFDL